MHIVCITRLFYLLYILLLVEPNFTYSNLYNGTIVWYIATEFYYANTTSLRLGWKLVILVSLVIYNVTIEKSGNNYFSRLVYFLL
jgi:hypothetical protein